MCIFSGYSCTGSFGVDSTPTGKKKTPKRPSSEIYIDETGNSLPLTWNKCTHIHIWEVYNFCLPTRLPHGIAGVDRGAGARADSIGAKPKSKELLASEVLFLPRQDGVGTSGFESLVGSMAAVQRDVPMYLQ